MPEPITLGVEEEFLVVDAHTGELVPLAPELLEVCAEGDPDLRIMGELNLCQVEIDTTVCTSLSQVSEELATMRGTAATMAGEVGAGLLATGTHPFSAWEDQAVDEQVRRYAEMVDRYRLIAEEHVICGCHVHVGLPTRPLEIPVMNRVLPWLPVTLALSVNSPFWQGLDSGYESYRSEVWQRWPTAGFPPTLHDRDDYAEVLEELQRAEVIREPKDLYWHIRPSHAHPTLEFRICDVPLYLEDTVTLAGIIRALAWVCAYSETMPSRRHSRDLLDAGMWRAARWGLSGDLIDPVERAPRPALDVIDRLLDMCRPGLDAAGDRQVVEDGVQRIIDRGTGASVQRRLSEELESAQLIQELRVAGGTLRPDAARAS